MMQIQNPLDQIYSEAQQCHECSTIPPQKVYEDFGVKFPVAYYSKEEGGINGRSFLLWSHQALLRAGRPNKMLTEL